MAEKKNLLELYNALNDTHYSELDDLKLTTIDDVVYMGMKNDVSLLIHSRMALFEHQSTYNPNMPIRGMMYAARLYDKHIEENKLNIYSTDLMKLPTPQYIVFYNGNEKHEDEEILRLSDVFETEEKTAGYECIREDVLADFLRKHRAEVMDVCITEYNEERVMDAIREEGYADGCEITAAHAKVQAVENVMISLNVSVEEACKILRYLLDDYEAAKILVNSLETKKGE